MQKKRAGRLNKILKERDICKGVKMGLFTKEFNYNFQKPSAEKKAMETLLERYDARFEEYEKTLSAYEAGIEENEKMLSGYKNQLAETESMIHNYECKLRSFSSTEEDQMAAVQVALDLTYIKEELDVMKKHTDQLFSQKTNEIIEKQEDIIKRFMDVNASITEPLKRQMHSQEASLMDFLKERESQNASSSRGIKIMLGISLFMNFLMAGGLTFIILYVLGIISF